ncbi:MAG: hypothetical protein AB7Q42_22635 [Acidimicrobiia bacterium]
MCRVNRGRVFVDDAERPRPAFVDPSGWTCVRSVELRVRPGARYPAHRHQAVPLCQRPHGSSREQADVERIHALAIPPAWTQVWIAADPWSHLQATGRDARGRKQYRYHDAFTSSRSENKFADLVAFGFRLGSLRRCVTRDLARNDLGHDRVVATVIRLMDITSLRIGNIEYATTNESFGLTTLRNQHVAVRGSTIRLAFSRQIGTRLRRPRRQRSTCPDRSPSSRATSRARWCGAGSVASVPGRRA